MTLGTEALNSMNRDNTRAPNAYVSEILRKAVIAQRLADAVTL